MYHRFLNLRLPLLIGYFSSKITHIFEISTYPSAPNIAATSSGTHSNADTTETESKPPTSGGHHQVSAILHALSERSVAYVSSTVRSLNISEYGREHHNSSHSSVLSEGVSGTDYKSLRFKQENLLNYSLRIHETPFRTLHHSNK